jgi:hypothetical protein
MGIAIPPLSWVVHVLALVPLRATMCSDSELVLHVVTLVAAATAAAGGAFGYTSWRAVGGGYDIRDADAWTGRVRFMALGGMALALIFSLAIVGQWLMVVTLAQCRG